MLIKLTKTIGFTWYVDAFTVQDISVDEKGTRVCGYYVKESAEQIAKAVNAARLLAYPYTGRKEAALRASSDTDIAGMLPVAMLMGIAFSDS